MATYSNDNNAFYRFARGLEYKLDSHQQILFRQHFHPYLKKLYATNAEYNSSSTQLPFSRLIEYLLQDGTLRLDDALYRFLFEINCRELRDELVRALSDQTDEGLANNEPRSSINTNYEQRHAKVNYYNSQSVIQAPEPPQTQTHTQTKTTYYSLDKDNNRPRTESFSALLTDGEILRFSQNLSPHDLKPLAVLGFAMSLPAVDRIQSDYRSTEDRAVAIFTQWRNASFDNSTGSPPYTKQGLRIALEKSNLRGLISCIP